MVLLLLLLAGAYYFLLFGLPFAHLRGRLTAQRDVLHGKYRILTYGLATLDRGEYARLLQDRYGIEVHAIAGCIVRPSQVDYASGYNEVVKASLQQRLKRDVLAEMRSKNENAHGASSGEGQALRCR
jgi:hypothetical protein